MATPWALVPWRQRASGQGPYKCRAGEEEEDRAMSESAKDSCIACAYETAELGAPISECHGECSQCNCEGSTSYLHTCDGSTECNACRDYRAMQMEEWRTPV